MYLCKIRDESYKGIGLARTRPMPGLSYCASSDFIFEYIFLSSIDKPPWISTVDHWGAADPSGHDVSVVVVSC